MAKIGFIGMGNMGAAIMSGLLKSYKPEDMIFTAAHLDVYKRQVWIFILSLIMH